MTWIPRTLAVAAAMCACAVPSVGLATTYAQVMSVDQLIERSERVVKGTVTATQGRWTDKGYIETLVTVEVDEVYVGQAGDTVTVVAPGGTVEGKTLSIDGAPTFEVGARVLVFADGKKIVGFGQGAFGVDGDNVATRSLGNEVAHQHLRLELAKAFGQPDRAQECINQHIHASTDDGWKLRGATGTRLGREDVSMWRVNLIEGLEYRFNACADGTFGAAHLLVADADGAQLARAEPGAETSLTFKPASSGIYFVGVYAEALTEGVWRGAASMSIHYR